MALGLLGASAVGATMWQRGDTDYGWGLAGRCGIWLFALLAFGNIITASTQTCPEWFISPFKLAGLGTLVEPQASGQSIGPERVVLLEWLTGLILLPCALRHLGTPAPGLWKLLVTAWFFSGSVCWLFSAYLQNRPAAFYFGLALNVALLILTKRWFRMPAWAVLALNTAILMLAGLPMADLFVHPSRPSSTYFEPGRPYYSYETGKKDRRSYQCWWNFILGEWERLRRRVGPIAGEQRALIPNSAGKFFHSDVRINSLGFRGKEIRQPKGNTYRIVALGESTTFGMTLEPTDRPWPEVLEQMIQDNLKPRRPVEVINAGVPGFSIGDNLARFTRDILPVQPEMILSYHGFNGFSLVDNCLPVVVDPSPPAYPERPVKLLANLEYLLAIHAFNSRRTSPPSQAQLVTNVIETAYARDYRRLIEMCKTNRLDLVLGTFSMAVNAHSDPDVVRFYRQSFPDLQRQIKANETHSAIVRQLVREQPGVTLVDTQPFVDGQYTNFTDLVHFTQEGRQRIAEAFFESIKGTLEHEILGPTASSEINSASH
jgi:lysophospholipase L1-like esterase